ncbi:unnamed protein product [Owenia fusiformis]|nr:unnamed protein product [Owenia fusiformis]
MDMKPLEGTEIGDSSLRQSQCKYISYFSSGDREDKTTTELVIDAMRRSTIFPVIALLVILLAVILCFLGHCNQKKKVLTFLSGIFFVVGGLLVLIGIILYIGAITEESGTKPKGTLNGPRFKYEYGTSFMLCVGAFALTELSGVLSVYLYISKHKHAYRKKQEQLKHLKRLTTMIDCNSTETPLTNHTAALPHGHQRLRRGSRSRGSLSRRNSLNSRSRDHSPTHSETYYTYTPVSDHNSREMSNFTLHKDPSRNTLATTVDTHISREHSSHSMDTLRRTTPV